MNLDPGHRLDWGEVTLQLVARHVVTELNARLDREDLDGVLDLYADDASVGCAKGKDAIEESIRLAAKKAGQATCHSVANFRAVVDDEAVVTVDCTLLKYVLDDARPYRASEIVSMRYVLEPDIDGNLRVIQQIRRPRPGPEEGVNHRAPPHLSDGAFPTPELLRGAP